jgi:hypothetical protein
MVKTIRYTGRFIVIAEIEKGRHKYPKYLAHAGRELFHTGASPRYSHLIPGYIGKRVEVIVSLSEKIGFLLNISLQK